MEAFLTPQMVQNVVTYDAVIDVDNTELKLRPGMTANVTFIYAEKDDALRIPNAALRFRPPPALLARVQHDQAAKSRDLLAPARRTVWVLRDETPSEIPVSTGISDGTLTEVVEGHVHAGDLLITDISGGLEAPQNVPPSSPGTFRRIF